MTAPINKEEQRRVAALERYGVMGTPPEQVYDDLTLMAAKSLHAPISSLSFVSEAEQWFKSQRGAVLLSGPRKSSFCNYTISNSQEATVVEDTRQDKRFSRLPLVRRPPYIRSYAGAPLLTPDGYAIGALSVMDTDPRNFTIEQIELLGILARQVVTQLELRRQTILLTAANEKLQTLASSDGLTGLRNFRAFRDNLDEELFYASRNHSPVSLIFLDVDKFKEYNDEFGHPAGDDVLKAVSFLLLESSREYDIVARYGGEEFAVLLRGADAAEAYAVAERLRVSIAGARWPLRPITASLGVVTLSPSHNSREALIREADRLLYLSKEMGRNRVSQSDADDYFDPGGWDEIGVKERAMRLVTSDR